MKRGVNLIISSVGALLMGVFLRWGLSVFLISYIPWARPEICSYFDKPQPGSFVKIPPCENFFQSLEFMLVSFLGLIVLSFVAIFYLLKMYQK